jgi:diadenylate cyclase
MSDIGFTDIAEMIILSVVIYYILVWIKTTRAWTLVKGFIVILVFWAIASIFDMNTILWIANRVFDIGILAIVIVFQPELRRALEQLGQKNIIADILSLDNSREREEMFNDRTVEAIMKACTEMSKVRTGALIVVANSVALGEYERTGISMDAQVSSQLLLNVFEHNTPLHDGAVIIRGNRIVAATCYLPLSDNMALSKELGTRHRAAVGISEVSDALTVVVSEETGMMSITSGGELKRNVTVEELRERLLELKEIPTENKRFRPWKGWKKDEDKLGE